MYNIKDVIKVLGLHERTVFRLIEKGELKGFKVGREWRFEEKDIQEYIEQQRRKAEIARIKKEESKQRNKDRKEEDVA